MAEPAAPDGWQPEPDEEAYWLLRSFAVERDELYRQLGAARGEVERLRSTLRRWQTQHRYCVRRGPANQGLWGGFRW